MKKLIAVILLLFLPVFSFPPTASAQMFQEWTGCTDKTVDGATGGTVSEVATLRCLPVIFHNLVSGLLIFVGAVALIMIVYSAIKLILSGGDPKQVTAARQIMTYAIIGAVLVLSSFAILYFIGYITGSEDRITNIDCLKTTAGCN